MVAPSGELTATEGADDKVKPAGAKKAWGDRVAAMKARAEKAKNAMQKKLQE